MLQQHLDITLGFAERANRKQGVSTEYPSLPFHACVHHAFVKCPLWGEVNHRDETRGLQIQNGCVFKLKLSRFPLCDLGQVTFLYLPFIDYKTGTAGHPHLSFWGGFKD